MRTHAVLRSGYVDIGFRVLLKQVLPHVPTTDLTTQLKQQALLFDKIGIYNSDWYLEQIRNNPFYHSHVSWLNNLELELQWLKDNGVIVDIEKTFPSAPKTNFEEAMDVRTNHIQASWNLIIQSLKNGNVSIDKFIMNLAQSDAIRLREYIADLADSKEFSAVSSLDLKDYLYDGPEFKKSEVVQMVISKLPVPSAMTPWEKIIDYRADPESKKNLLGLRRWISNISFGSLPSAEIEEEIEWLLDNFQSHMRFHKMKADTETIEVLLKSPLDLVTFKWSKLMDAGFAFKKRKISLMEAELNAPGKELAYVIKTKENFPNEE